MEIWMNTIYCICFEVNGLFVEMIGRIMCDRLIFEGSERRVNEFKLRRV